MRRVAILAMLLCACRGELAATELIVTVDTTFGVPCTIDALHVEAIGDGDPVTADVAVGDDDLPGSIALVPHGDPGEVTVQVSGMRDGAVFATATATVSFADEATRELRFVLDRSCVPGPCKAVGVGRFVGLPQRQSRRGCGEHGYSWAPGLFAMRDACAMRESIMGSVLGNAEEKEALLSPAMPFPFWFYGAPVTRLWAGTNGYIGLDDGAPGALLGSVGQARSLGLPGFPGRGVLAFWDELRTSAAGVCFAVSGEPPDRILWITWKDACFSTGVACGPPALGRLTFGIALEETTDHVYVGYLAMGAAGNASRANGFEATIGVTSAAPRGCLDIACLADGMCEDGSPCGYTEFSSGVAINPLPTLEFDPR